MAASRSGRVDAGGNDLFVSGPIEKAGEAPAQRPGPSADRLQNNNE